MNENLQKISKPINSAFKPINPSQTMSNSAGASNSGKPSKSKQHGSNTADEALSASSSYSSTSSSSSSWSSSSSSSNSPPKSRLIANSAQQQPNTTISISTPSQAQSQPASNNYKHPCLISPRKEAPVQPQPQPQQQQHVSIQNEVKATATAQQLASLTDSFLDSNASKSLTILIRNNSVDESAASGQQKQQLSSSSTITNGADYEQTQKKHPLRRAITQPCVPKVDSKPIKHSNMDMIRTGHLWKWSESRKLWEKYWFSLNSSSLVYWNEKIEQDLGKAYLSKIELYKCVFIKEIYSVEFENYSFQLIYHNASTIFKAITSDVRNNWIQAIHQSLEQSPSTCPKCKPKLVVNPLQANQSISPASATSSTSTQVAPPAPLSTTTTTFTTSTTNPQPSNTSITITCVNSAPQSRLNTENTGIEKPSPPIKIESQSKIDPCSLKSDCIPERLAPSQPKAAKINDVDQYEKLVNENNEIKLKYKLLEEIHYDTMSDFDKRQTQLYNQLDDMSAKCSQRDLNHESLLKETHISYEHKTQAFNDKLDTFDALLQAKDHEICKLKEKLNEVTLTQKKSSNVATTWNSEVRNLDARINDVLGKIKERELLLNNYDDWERKYKELDKSFGELVHEFAKSKALNEELRKRIDELSSKKPSLHDFDDDLAKVLISKEETITQLETTIHERDKAIAQLHNSGKEKNSAKLAERIKALESDNEKKVSEIDVLKDDVDRLNGFIDELEQQLAEMREAKLGVEQRYESVAEASRNEIDTLQEEIKTLEYKFAHSQKEGNELRSLLNEANCSLSRCKKVAAQNVSEAESESEAKIAEMRRQIDEFRHENYELNEHIYALDEFMRDKEAQIEVLEQRLGQSEDSKNELNELRKIINSLKDSQFLDAFVNIFNSDDEKLHDFVKRLAHLLRLLSEQANGAVFLHEVNFSEESFVSLFDSTTQLGSVCEGVWDSRKAKKAMMALFKRLKASQSLLRKQMSKLNEFYANESSKFNAQLVTYMTEQMVHKAALNGHLKFACELLRKKCSDSLILIPNAGKMGSLVNSNGAASSINTQYQKSVSGYCGKQNGEFDESLSKKLMKITSELLVCDEDSLRKLSGQILNEAEHLDQLNVVVNALRKIRVKQFGALYAELMQTFDKLAEMEHSNENLVNTDDFKLSSDAMDDESEINYEQSEDDFDEADARSQLHLIDNHKAEKLSFILNSITDIYTQHKLQVCDQLNEVHKLMSISSDDELIVHLQSENTRLQQELISVKSSLENYSLKTLSNASNSNSMSSLQYSPINTPTSRFNCSPFTLSKDRSSNSDSKSQMYGQILTDLLSQDDTMC